MIKNAYAYNKTYPDLSQYKKDLKVIKVPWIKLGLIFY